MKTVLQVSKIKKSLKPILPTLKAKKRYLVFEIISQNRIKGQKSAESQIMAKIQEFLGILGMAKAGIMLVKFDPEQKKGMLRVGHTHVDELKAALAFVDKIDDEDAVIRSVGVSGILKKAEQRYM